MRLSALFSVIGVGAGFGTCSAVALRAECGFQGAGCGGLAFVNFFLSTVYRLVRRECRWILSVGGQFAADADFAIGEGNGRKFGCEHRHRAALVRYCALTGFSCLPVNLRGASFRIRQCGTRNFLNGSTLISRLAVCSFFPCVRSLAHKLAVRKINCEL